MAELVNIKQIQLSDGAHDIDAKYWNGHEWSELGNPLRFLGAAQSEVPTAGRYVKVNVETHPGTEHFETFYIPVTTEGAATEISAEKGDVFIIPSAGVEYLCIGAGMYPDAQWTCLGDETNFQQLGITLQTSTPSVNATSSAGAQEITINAGTLSVVGTAAGIIDYEYSQVDAATGSAGASSTTDNTGSAGAATINGSSFGFSGTTWNYNEDVAVTGIAFDDHAARTLSLGGTISVPKHSHTVTAPTGSVWGFSDEENSTNSSGDHTHDVSINTHEHGTAVDASKITGYTAPSMTTISFTPNTLQTLTTKNYGFGETVNNVMHSATVSAAGVLSWSSANASAQDVLSEGTQASLSGGVFSAGTLTYSSVSAAGAVSAKTLELTTGNAGEHDHSFNCTSRSTYVSSVTVNEKAAEDLTLTQAYANLPSLSHAQNGTASVNLQWSYKPAGTITGSATIASHSHSYYKPVDHTHTIGSTMTAATTNISLAVTGQAAEHSHTVNVAAHTHDLGNHTHNVTTSNN